jgi:hypothetical protein
MTSVSKVKKALAAVAEKLGINQRLLSRAQNRYRANRRRAFVAHNTGVRHDRAADALRAAGHPRAAEKRNREADRAHGRAYRNSRRAQWWLGRIKVLTQRIEKLEAREHDLLEELRKLKEVTIKGNTATGGSDWQRWRAVCTRSVLNCARGVRRNFYSQGGTWDVDHPIVPGEAYGERSDCSQTVTAWAKAAGLPDPNGASYTGGYTGTLVGGHNGWRQVSRAEMLVSHKPAYVIYGGGTGHHVEAYIGPGDRTAGHGSAPVDFGVIDLFGDGDYRCFIFDPRH